ncbi:ROK family protein [Flavobacterium sp. NRK1]|uniref:ROK family protein n=1 Tax=Flavobacterium sp. NRK1 TaxID=2954929 RepID=UPI002093D00D|nr:ROK family protein [Flavobacterium sp. NRK1]MCO6149669.1 ROK family protein [Flavobacterium sp. NRK1]
MALYYLGIDVGGSHLSGAILNSESGLLVANSYQKIAIDPNGSCDDFFTGFKNLIDKILAEARINSDSLAAMGIAMPGPFDYKNGISKIYGVKKYDALFGLNVKHELEKIAQFPVYFINDAESFAFGEYTAGAAAKSSKSIVLTLGTGFGSTFLIEGSVQTKEGNGVPENGYLYNIPFKDGIADDYLSTRWFINQWENLNRGSIVNVEALTLLADQNDTDALRIFDAFANNLASFIKPWLDAFKPQNLVLGGGIAKAAPYFIDILSSKLNLQNTLDIKICQLWEEAAIIGAATHAKNSLQIKVEKQNTEWRKTQQFLAPVKKSIQQEYYDLYPSFPLGNSKIASGALALAEWIANHKAVIIDGYVGVFWDNVVKSIDAELVKLGKKARWFHVDAALKSAKELDEMLEPYLGGDDPLFGKITDKNLVDWFDTNKLSHIQQDALADINIIIGSGSVLSGWDAPIVYFDLPKNELQFRARAGMAGNLGVENRIDNRRTYKRFFFIDWVVLNKHKNDIFSKIDLMVDEQRPDEYLFIKGNDLRNGLAAMATNVFRPRPWFEPGAWGGTWMKEHMDGLNKDVDNLAWSFELMVLENGLLFESDGYLLEVSFDTIMFSNYKDVLGDCAETFKYDFPIRFDFLDTFDGGNLSIQCHPGTEYIKEHFGMPFTQDETYYILDCKEDPVVYLGFQEGINPQEFRDALTYSQKHVEKLDVDKYIQKFKAKKHDLFLIPNGTIHASGSNNMVLEISAAPYIFTFKMYDWLRLDLDGKPRPINIERGMENLNFERSGDVVIKELISQPYLLVENDEYTIEHLPTHPVHFYDIYRYHITGKAYIETNNKCHVWMIVEGQSVKVVTENGISQIFNYAETFVIPASAKSYTIYNLSPVSNVIMVKSFVK